MKKIIIYNEVDWNFLDQRHHHLARYFASKEYEVEFVERVVSRIPSLSYFMTQIKRKIFTSKNVGHKVEKKSIENNIIIRRSLFLPHVYGVFSVYNYFIWLFYERRKQDNAIVYSFVDNPYIIGKRLNFFKSYKRSVFDIIHNWWEFPWRKTQHRLSVVSCIQTFDEVVTDSKAISSKLSDLECSNHLMLPGVSSNWFVGKHCEPVKEELKPVFFGNLRSNSDIELITQIAQFYPLDLYGRIAPEVENELLGCSFMGSVTSKSLPIVLKNYNTILLPYNKDAFSQTISPAKYFESLATGSLVITRANFSHLPGFNEYCICLNRPVSDLKKHLELCFEKHNRQRTNQIEFSKTHTWESRFKLLMEYINE